MCPPRNAVGGSVSITGNFPVPPLHRKFSGGTGIFRSSSHTGIFPVGQRPAKGPAPHRDFSGATRTRQGTRPSPGISGGTGIFPVGQGPAKGPAPHRHFPVAPGFSGATGTRPSRDPPLTGIFRWGDGFPCMRLHNVV
jgi:hypothetical protein